VTEYAPGWYPDPSGSNDQRWFDGVQWTSATAPSQPPVTVPAEAQQFWTAPPAWVAQPQQPGLQPGSPSWGNDLSRHSAQGQPAGLLARNRYTAITAGIAAVYLLLAISAHVAVIGFLPVLMSARAFRAKEPLALASAVIAGISVIIALALLTR
jgi:hypothetical protein